jgi:anthranilate synthase component 2
MGLNILLLDNYDSFTYMLKDYIEQGGASCTVIRNDELGLTDAALKADAIVISPGPKNPAAAGKLMTWLSSIVAKKPILGVCLGHQAIGELYGATLCKAQYPKHGKIETIHHHGNALFANVNSTFTATRYHSLVLRNLPDTLEEIAIAADGEIMGIAHKHLPIWGIQFHPESCTTVEGLKIIKNFLHLTELYL